MRPSKTHNIINTGIAAVWLINGLFCKVLHWSPRHEAIVNRILHTDYSREITIIIGVSEIVMALWIVSRYQSKWNAIAQIIIVASMNILEFLLASDLLLWGKLNAVFALLFIIIVYFNNLHNRPH
ncbi:DoxX-like family protein [Lacinutrix neustonica]|uniref:DoxX-like family protein n=1 Tax=Lacinutrix neustonica TaxID=2980107 RepID=A0A9E8SFA9_9FLAO|nr:DoxX-like family protein [Lacinutrix neustonica]WAC03617.1 DoxX-like family protein [Lacinutrix neustonica]